MKYKQKDWHPATKPFKSISYAKSNEMDNVKISEALLKRSLIFSGFFPESAL
jgi:hypothetical protein